ncbi:hypothetical protein AB0873_15625 [Micromonospora sp. NPDC047707]|uniref:hypothetical protein n=1 Tax=Micromonospora sp. NPDC047707 TaxID=3154498 RepID=UPI00345600EB
MTDIRRLVTAASLTAALALGGAPAAAYAGPAVDAATTAAEPPGAATCATAPSTPAKTPLGGFVRSTAHNTCSSYAVFWLLRYEPGGWRTVLERWMEPHTTARLDFDCRGTGPHTYRSVMWDPNMMGYLASPDVVIAC